MKGCALFAALFLLGIATIISGIAYDVAVAQNTEAQALPARVLELTGMALAFGSVFGVSGWFFYRRRREEAEEAKQRAAGSGPTGLSG